MIGSQLTAQVDVEAREQSRLSVLVIDDNPGDRRLAEVALVDGADDVGATCGVLLAGSLGEATAELQENESNPDAILLDLGLPDSTEFEALTSLSSQWPEIPVIILTGRQDTATAAAALKYGASDYLEKDEIRPRSLWRTVSYAVERKKLEAELLQHAVTDSLTGLKNRRALLRDLEHSIAQADRSGFFCAVLMIDVDNFKQTNDLFGHDVGDEVLKEVASRIEGAVRYTDTVGRLGGDEFAVVANNLSSAHDASAIAEKISRSINSTIYAKGRPTVGSSSIGIAVFPSDEISAGAVLSCADMAMYKAKRVGGGAICYYDEKLHQELSRRNTLRTMMFNDIRTSNFYLDYQPIVDTTTHRIIAAEGLARWKREDGGVIMPGEFIPIAEENGWITNLGSRMIDQACQFVRKSLEANAPVVPISINVSPLQCQDPKFPAETMRTIVEYGLDPCLFNIEVTESTVMENLEVARASLEELASAGIGIHMDDFGTGYSSLSLLRELPLKQLKLDRSFVSKTSGDPGTRRIMEAISDLARKLDFKTVAEGVETEEQVEFLAEIGVDYLQGFFFYRPISASNLSGTLVETPNPPQLSSLAG